MKDTALVRMTIDEIAKQKNIPLDAAFDLFYKSKICELLSDRETGLFTYAPQDLAEMVDLSSQGEAVQLSTFSGKGGRADIPI
jgi:antitoxin component of RelBE/YafQ-DinJ toxin-antitoxin module